MGSPRPTRGGLCWCLAAWGSTHLLPGKCNNLDSTDSGPAPALQPAGAPQGTASKLLLLLLLPKTPDCSFVKELQALRHKLEAGHDAAADFSLVSLVRALRDNAGAIKEGAHDAVLTTVLSISLWGCSSVSVCLVGLLARSFQHQVLSTGLLGMQATAEQVLFA